MEIVGHDLNPNRQRLRQPLPAFYKFVIYGAVALLAICVAWAAFNFVKAASMSALADSARDSTEELEKRDKELDRQLSDRSSSAAKAENLLDWAKLGWHAQSFLVDALANLPETVELVELACELKEGHPQMTLTLRMKGSDAALLEAREMIADDLYRKGILVGEAEPPRVANGVAVHRLLLSIGNAQPQRSNRIMGGEE